MSRSFDGVDDNILVNSPIVASAPITLACWFMVPDVTNGYTLMGVGDQNSLGEFSIRSQGNIAGDPVRFNESSDAGSNGTVDTLTSIVANKWNFAAAVGISDSSREVYLNSDGKGTNTTSITAPTITRFKIGERSNNQTIQDLNGFIAHAHIYNVALTQNEIKQIMFFPGSIRRGLIGYWPLWGTSSPEPDLSGNKNNGTVTGAIKGTTEPPINNIFTIDSPMMV